MSGRELVWKVLENGEAERIPLHVEADDKEMEARLGDIVGMRVKIPSWERFYERGGPFRRERGERLMEWIERLEIEDYPWELSRELESAIESFIDKARKYSGNKFVLLKVLGPTETAEAFCAPPISVKYRRLGQIAHRFDFAVLVKLSPTKALKLYERIARTILELVKAGAELDFVDGIRIADDVAGYQGPLYPKLLIRHYLEWHRLFATVAKRRGKWVILHSDGDLRKGGLLGELAKIYDGLHPLDIGPKATLRDAIIWACEVGNLRREIGDRRPAFFTGMPVDLIFNDDVPVSEFAKVVHNVVREHGRRWLVLATTHDPYPGRGYRNEIKPRKKIAAAKEIASGITDNP